MPTIVTFIWGFIGSWAVEIVGLYLAFRSRPISIPDRYKCRSFWLTCFLMASVGGALAVAMDANTPILALGIGAAAPKVITALVQRRGRLPLS